MGGRLHLGPLLGGFALVVVCIRFLSVYPSYATFGGGHDGPERVLSYIGVGEFRLWLGVFLLAVPGCIAMAYALEARLGPALRGVMQRVDRMSPRRWGAAGLVYFAVLLIVAQVGNGLLLMGHPITDDESAVRFGGQLWAAGRTMVPALEPRGAWNDLFMFRRGGMVASMDWPGVIGASAIATMTGLGTTVYAILTATTGLMVAMTGRRLFGPRGAPLAAIVWLVSPMALSLGLTNHAHVVSRCWVAIAIYLFARLHESAPSEGALRGGFALGFIVGLGACTRPFETAALMAPAAAVIAYAGARGGAGDRRKLIGCVVGLVGPLLLHALYNQHMTGDALLAPRLSSAILGATPALTMSVWDRFGFNMGHNLLMLAVWFWGPVGIVLAWLGSRRDSTVLRALAIGVVLSLLVALGHTDVGIHTVGPIHYSEAVVPLCLLAAGGIFSVMDVVRKRDIALGPASTMLAGYCAAMVFFILQYSVSLRLQGEFLDFPYAVLRHHGVDNGLILAPPPAARGAMQRFSAASWQLAEPTPDPFLRDPLLFPRWDADVSALHARLPDRDIYRLHVGPRGTRLVALDPDHPELTPSRPPGR